MIQVGPPATHRGTAASTLSRWAVLLVGAATATLVAFTPVIASADHKEATKNKEAKMETAATQLDRALSAVAGAIRPYQVHIPEEALTDLRRRIQATRWPDKETVTDRSQGANLADLHELVRYWGSGYDWRKVEAKLNALPQFVTTIDSVDIYFIHVRSRHPNAMPLIVTHGWPGSVIERLKIIGPLTDPTAHGCRAEDAFDVVIPSLPGYGFSGKPMGTGWDPAHIARAWTKLMKRLGYTRFVAQGGDWGSPVTSEMARNAAAPGWQPVRIAKA